MEESADAVLGKLAKNRVELSISYHKYAIEKLKKELADLEPVAIPAGADKKKILLFGKKKLKVVEVRIEQIKEMISRLSTKKIEGFLTPITVEEHFEVQQYYAMQRIAMKRTQPAGLTLEGLKDFETSVDIASNGALQAKSVQIVLKAKEKKDGRWQRLFTMEQVIGLEPQVMVDILTFYYKEFQLSEEELEKSHAPMKKDS